MFLIIAQAIIANGFVFASGQLPVVPETGNIISEDVKEQTVLFYDLILYMCIYFVLTRISLRDKP